MRAGRQGRMRPCLGAAHARLHRTGHAPSGQSAHAPTGHNDQVIDRYTRTELGALWTDMARMETWRRVEVAACEELPALLGDDGPTETELHAIRGATFTV